MTGIAAQNGGGPAAAGTTAVAGAAGGATTAGSSAGIAGTAGSGGSEDLGGDPANDSPPTDSFIVPGPEPFSVDAFSAIQLIAMLKRVGLLEVYVGKLRPDIVAVKTVWAIPVGINSAYPVGHRRRYDIVLNGSRIDWDNTYIFYDEAMTNLRALFTYRNQYPPKDLQLSVP